MPGLDASKSKESEESQTVVEEGDDSDKNRGKEDIRTTVENGSPQNHKVVPKFGGVAGVAQNSGANSIGLSNYGLFVPS